MSQVARVLCAVDIDDPTSSAFEQALAVARVHNASLVLVCAVPPGQPWNERATDRLTYLLKVRRAAEAAGVDVRVVVRAGEAAETVILAAETRRADLIVIAVEHLRGEGRAWGAVAEDVLRLAPCPTLVVPAGAAVQPTFRNILCAVALSHDPDLRFEEALRLADPRDRRVTVLHVAKTPVATGAALQRLQALIPRTTRSIALARVTVGQRGAEILNAARAIHADLLVIGARRRSQMGRRLFGVTGELLTAARRPVLAVPIDSTVVKRVEKEAA